jgi:hypothetical protein
MQSNAITCNHMQSHAITCNHMQSHAITCNHMHSHAFTCNHMQITCNHMQSHAVTRNHTQSHAITRNHMQSHAITCNHMQSHAITVGGNGSTTSQSAMEVEGERNVNNETGMKSDGSVLKEKIVKKHKSNSQWRNEQNKTKGVRTRGKKQKRKEDVWEVVSKHVGK